MTDRDHTHFQEDVGAYLLGALAGPEREAFERHLDGCELCRQDVAHLRAAADELPRSVEQFEPPESLKDSIMNATRAAGRKPSRTRRGFGFPALMPRLAWAGVALLVAAIVGAGSYQLGRSSGETDRTLIAQVDQSRLGGEAGGRLLIPDEDGEGAVLEVSGMPRPAPGRLYYVWVRRGEEVTPVAQFNVGRDGEGVAGISGDLGDVDEIMVTRERGTVLAPTEPPVLDVRL